MRHISFCLMLLLVVSEISPRLRAENVDLRQGALDGAILDDFETSFMCGDQAASGIDGHLALDAICRARLGSVGLVASARRAQAIAPDTSLLFLVTGAESAFEDVARAAAAFGPEVRRIALFVDTSAPSRAAEVDGMPVLHMSRKPDLPALLRWSVR